MTVQEIKYLVSFFTTALVSTLYALRIHTLAEQGYFGGPDGDILTGRALLILVGLIIGAGILGQIVFTIVAAIAGHSAEFDEDERDRQIDQRAMRAAFVLVGMAMIGALIMLATGATPFLSFHILVFGMVAAGLIADLWRIALYRRGF
jgi:heme A synthase